MEARILIPAYLTRFSAALRAAEKSAATVEKYARDAAAFAAYAAGGEVTKEIAVAWKSKLRKEGYTARSVNSMIAGVNSLFAFLGWHDLRVKTLKLQREIFCSEEKELTKDEYARLVRAAKEKQNERLALILSPRRTILSMKESCRARTIRLSLWRAAPLEQRPAISRPQPKKRAKRVARSLF